MDREEKDQLQKIPGKNPLGFTPLDFRGSEETIRLTGDYEYNPDRAYGRKEWFTDYYVMSSNSLDMKTLRENFYDFHDLWARATSTRMFETNERKFKLYTYGIGSERRYVAVAEAVEANSDLATKVGVPGQGRHYVDEFTFGESPTYKDLDLTENTPRSRNDDAAALIAYKIIDEGIGLRELFSMQDDISDIYPNLREHDFYQRLLTSFQLLFDQDIQGNLHELGLLTEENRDDVFTRASDWMAYCTLEVTAKSPSIKRVKINDPYPTGIWKEGDNFPSMESLMYIIRAFDLYFRNFPAYVGENQSVTKGSIEIAFEKLRGYVEIVCATNGVSFEMDEKAPEDTIVGALNAIKRVVDELEEFNEHYFGEVRDADTAEEIKRRLRIAIFGEE